jgi:hypothetical protein
MKSRILDSMQSTSTRYGQELSCNKKEQWGV